MKNSLRQQSPPKVKSPSKEASNEEEKYLRDASSALHISASSDRKDTDKYTKRRKRKKTAYRGENEENEEAMIDKAIEEKLQEVARKNNLSQIEMKKILKKLVGNEHVLALVKIQEDEEERIEDTQTDPNEDNPILTELDDDACMPKLTRAKARALNKRPIPLPPLNETEPEPDVAALISQDLHSDEDDDEYHPHEEELVSDDDPNTTISDIDSQPPTPNTPPQTLARPETPVHYTQDGLFKVPQDRSENLNLQHEEIIAKRTRSKLCLQTTPIEAIESNFVPPDITTDMYDLDVDMDHAWMEFLNEFTKPLNATTTAEEDDETDPEYVAADKVPIDREELRDVNISRKELSDLVAELFDGLVTSGAIPEEDAPLETPKKTLERSSDRSPVKKRQKINENQNPNNNQQTKSFETNLNSISLENVDLNLSQNNTIFNPNIMSTPQDSRLKSANNEVHHQNENVMAVPPYQHYNSSLSFPSTPMLPQTQASAYSDSPIPPVGSNISYNTSQLYPISGFSSASSSQVQEKFPQLVNNSSPALLAFHVPNTSSQIPTMPYQIAVTPSKNNSGHYIAIPTGCNKINCNSQSEVIDLTQSPEGTLTGSTNSKSSIVCKLVPTQIASKPTSSHSEPALPKSTTTSETSVGSMRNKRYQNTYDNLNFLKYEKWRSDIHVSINKYIRREYAEKNNALKTITFEEPQFDESKHGFTDFQLQILQQQMRYHVQFAAQNFFQTYGHPEFWKIANMEKQMLLTLEKYTKGRDNSFFNSYNLKPALKLMKDWEEELSVNNSKNRDFMDFLYDEIERAKNCNSHTTATIRFHPRVMRRILSSEVFMYPDLLPKIPFRVNVNLPYHEFSPSEDHLIALGMERYFKQLEEEEKLNTTCKRKISKLRIVCERIARDVTVEKSWRRILGRIKGQLQIEEYNPIKFYFERKRSPPFKHELKAIDINCAPQDRISELPLVWKEFACSVNASDLEQTFPQQHNVKSLKTCRDRKNLKLTRETISSTTTIQKTINKSRTNNNSAANIIVHFNCVLDNSLANNSEKANTNFANHLCEQSQFLTNDSSLSSLEEKHPSNTFIFNEKTDFSVGATETKSDFNFHQTECNIPTPYSHRAASVVEATSLQQKNNAYLGVDKVDQCESPSNGNTISSGQKLLTDYFKRKSQWVSFQVNSSKKVVQPKPRQRLKKQNILYSRWKYYKFSSRRSLNRLKNFKQIRELKLKLCFLVKSYHTKLDNLRKKYGNKYLQSIFINFKTLELYTSLLSDLIMSCRKAKATPIPEDSSCTKRTKLTCESVPNAKVRKAMRINEYLKRMITPESQDEIVKKDAIYALNFYDKVEETFKKEGKYESFRKFQSILKSFDPQRDQVADMYNKMERLFLPHYPDLAQILLTFLLPGEAAQIGKFFEHFMISNMGTFISKLNLYFSKQPAQLKKVYAALNELSEDIDLTLDKIKEKILPLLKGNQFLTEWFLQIFPSERPPERLVSVPENIKFKSMEGPKNEGDCENISFDELEADSSDDQACQIKYLNGRVFYGNKILLPAKLTFLADELEKENDSDSESEDDSRLNGVPEACLHGMRDLAEKRLKQATESCDDPDRSEEEDNRDNSKKYVICDNATFKAHAIRLNPSLYASDKESQQLKKVLSPKKTLKLTMPTIMKEKEKRKSPKKILPKSPGPKKPQNNLLAISLESCSKAIGTAKKLRSMLEDNLQDDQIKTSKQKENDKSKIEDDDEENIVDKAVEVHHVSDSEISLSNDDDSSGIIDSKPWTRDEDKIILEEVKFGFDNEEVLMEKLAANLPHRNKSEIIYRHQFLMDVLSQLQNRG